MRARCDQGDGGGTRDPVIAIEEPAQKQVFCRKSIELRRSCGGLFLWNESSVSITTADKLVTGLSDLHVVFVPPRVPL